MTEILSYGVILTTIFSVYSDIFLVFYLFIGTNIGLKMGEIGEI